MPSPSRAADPCTEPEPRPVFAAADGRRARLVGGFGGVLAAATAAWLIALVIGSIGFGRLPALHWLRSRGIPSLVAHRAAPRVEAAERTVAVERLRSLRDRCADRGGTAVAASDSEAGLRLDCRTERA